MARRSIARPAEGQLFDDETKLRIHKALDSLLDEHDAEALEAINEAELHQLSITLKLDIDRSESAPKIDLGLRFTPKTITDSRSIICTDPNQKEFQIMTPVAVAEMQAKAKAAAKDAEAAANAAEQPEGGAGGDGEGDNGKKPKKGKRKSD